MCVSVCLCVCFSICLPVFFCEQFPLSLPFSLCASVDLSGCGSLLLSIDLSVSLRLPLNVSVPTLSFVVLQAELQHLHADFLRTHPEVNAMLHDFMQALLQEKPADTYAFAARFFASFATRS
jgi:hypothetical protein